ncbi:SWI/SNF-related matrix-associated actin-dependent regulator of chromatin subfamily D member 3 [Marmota monax]|uniref:SWI/SNF-related matrix-associated actin-dependent regulator of chromatin subfamily D member 3 n=1 Tax=Marmota monax TaxID=9995 RepID=A0A834PMA5_MARMO|nr:SWI/SNF-related matrix-associated actin-dependent regulator of chromatin subfamily D member 3 [Marmota monax]
MGYPLSYSHLLLSCQLQQLSLGHTHLPTLTCWAGPLLQLPPLLILLPPRHYHSGAFVGHVANPLSVHILHVTPNTLEPTPSPPQTHAHSTMFSPGPGDFSSEAQKLGNGLWTEPGGHTQPGLDELLVRSTLTSCPLPLGIPWCQSPSPLEGPLGPSSPASGTHCAHPMLFCGPLNLRLTFAVPLDLVPTYFLSSSSDLLSRESSSEWPLVLQAQRALGPGTEGALDDSPSCRTLPSMTPGLQHPPTVVQRPGMPSGARMPHQGAPMGPPGSPYMGSPAVRPGLAPAGMEPARKRAAPPPGQSQAQSQGQPVPTAPARSRSAKRRKMADKILPQRIRELVPESQAYMDLLAFERKLDQTIMRKRVDIQEALKRPMKQKRKLRLYISNTFNPAKPDAEDSDGSIASWELRVEGKLLDDPSKQKRKFSSFFKSLVIELDKDLYGPDNHLVEWHRTPTTQETDGFQVKRPGDLSVRCTLLLMLDYQPPQFKLDPRLARLLGLHTQSRSAIVQALWQYVKTNRLQDSHDKEYINGDKYFQQIFDCPRLKFSEIPQRLTALLLPPDPIVINHVISVDPSDQKKTACYDIDVEVEEPLKGQMSSFLLSTANQQEISALDSKIHETIESINQLKIQRDFMLSFSRDPKGYVQDLLRSQSRDLKVKRETQGALEWETSTWGKTINIVH